MKAKWDAIRTIINRKKVSQSLCSIPNNILGNHYATFAEKLSRKLPKLSIDDIPSTSNHSKFIKSQKSNSTCKFQFKPITEREIYESILKLDVSKGPGIDNIDVKILKYIADLIAGNLASLFNLSIIHKIYPLCLKIAKCIPIFKGSPLDPTLPVNYRPISILTSINKIFEKALHSQMIRINK